MSLRDYLFHEEPGITLYCGETLNVLQMLDAESVSCVIADPPYSSGGMFRSDRQGEAVDKYRGWSHTPTATTPPKSVLPNFSGDSRDQRSYAYWSALWLSECLRISTAGAVCFTFSDWRQFPTTTDALQAGGWVWRGVVIWDKGIARPIKGRFRTNIEFVTWGSSGALPEHQDVYPSSIIAAAPPSNREHVTQKPLEVMAHLLSVAPTGCTVLDPFAGSGTTLEAAKESSRRAIGIEIEPKYCEIAVKRLRQEVLL